MELSAAASWINATFSSFDIGVSTAVHELYNFAGGFFTPFFEFISFLGKDGIILILIALTLTYFRKTRRFGTAMAIGLAIGAILTNLVLKVAIARPRPFADESSIFYQLWLTVGQNMESDKSFPSGHTTAAFAAMTAVYLVGDKRISWTAYIFAFLMGIARIYLVVHYPSDVVAGLVTGVVAGIVGTLIATKLPHKWYELEFVKRKEPGEECSDLEN